jgi:hypothetical protein
MKVSQTRIRPQVGIVGDPADTDADEVVRMRIQCKLKRLGLEWGYHVYTLGRAVRYHTVLDVSAPFFPWGE